jgi:hypothetical protein
MNSLWDIRIFLGLVPKESPCIIYTATYFAFFNRSKILQIWATVVETELRTVVEVKAGSR